MSKQSKEQDRQMKERSVTTQMTSAQVCDRLRAVAARNQQACLVFDAAKEGIHICADESVQQMLQHRLPANTNYNFIFHKTVLKGTTGSLTRCPHIEGMKQKAFKQCPDCPKRSKVENKAAQE